MAAPPPAPKSVYSVHRLSPTSPIFPTLSSRFTALRLRALLTSPHSFSSTHALESTFTPTEWQTRLSRPRVHIFIAVAHQPDTPPENQTIDNGEWVGKVTLLGPMSREAYELKESGGPVLGEDGVESRWQMTALYTEPDHRGRGLAKKIIQESVDYARRYDETAAYDTGDDVVANGVTDGTSSLGVQKPKQARVRIMIHPDNAVIVGMYQSLGFVDAGRCTLAEAFISDGDVSLLPEDGGDPEKFHVRKGLVMEVLKDTI